MHPSAGVAYTQCMQFTIRNVPPSIDTALRHRARVRSRSLNAVLLDALEAEAGLAGVKRRRRSLEGIAGSGALEPAVTLAIREQHRIDGRSGNEDRH